MQSISVCGTPALRQALLKVPETQQWAKSQFPCSAQQSLRKNRRAQKKSGCCNNQELVRSFERNLINLQSTLFHRNSKIKLFIFKVWHCPNDLLPEPILGLLETSEKAKVTENLKKQLSETSLGWIIAGYQCVTFGHSNKVPKVGHDPSQRGENREAEGILSQTCF